MPETSPNFVRDHLAARGLRAPFVYDLELFTLLNDLYRDRPLVPEPRKYDAESQRLHAETKVERLLTILPSFDGLNCLEIGCHQGYVAVRFAEASGARVLAVDLETLPEWEIMARPGRVSFQAVDLTEKNILPPESFDFIYSFVALEHVRRPQRMMEVFYELLKPGGTLFFTTNLYRGPIASHLYRTIYFPWPHLLFENEIIRQYHERQGLGVDVRCEWVNKMTQHHYINQARQLGFREVKTIYSGRPDQIFAECFAEKLDSYPPEDLKLDIMAMHLIRE